MIYYITEGQQAEEYKARKAKEAEDKKNVEKARDERRYGTLYNDDDRVIGVRNKTIAKYLKDGSLFVPRGELTEKEYNKFNQDIHRYDTARDKIEKDFEKRHPDLYESNPEPDDRVTSIAMKYSKATDSAYRHARRHPKQYKESCGIFSNVYFI